jgi:hypothetical protein
MLWLYEETRTFSFSLADEMTEIKAALIARCGDLGDDDDARGEVVDLSAARLARQKNCRQP